ncbi:MAG: YbhB/YbcL family Raf kinase inhibitor-like protein [Actinomycetota bacterium]|nr:YbhB/YbcL family Raf kinase inhibitor-like protein [Actinomycetota bacterium]
MRLTTSSFRNGGPIPDRYALATPDPDSHVTFAENVNPELSWDEVPEGTRSFAIITLDPDVPSRADDVNQEGREVPSDLPRVDFFHWVTVELPPELRSIAEGEFCIGVMPHGKNVALGPRGCRQGLNDFTGWFAGDPDMAGKYFGYDGPAPPWNDSILHRYIFTVYALDIEEVPVLGEFTGHQVRDAIAGHVLDQASVTGTYTQNIRLRT